MNPKSVEIDGGIQIDVLAVKEYEHFSIEEVWIIDIEEGDITEVCLDVWSLSGHRIKSESRFDLDDVPEYVTEEVGEQLGWT